MNIVIVGLGLIGGSLALALKDDALWSISGIELSSEHANTAIKMGLIDQILDLDVGAKEADVVILAIAVDAIESLLPFFLDHIKTNAVVIDVGSTKYDICNSVTNHRRRGRFVAAHPLAGTEFSGPTAAKVGLFNGKKNIICQSELVDDDALSLALNIFEKVGLISYFMDAQEHDKHMAYISHLSHVSSFTLGLTVLDIEKDEHQIFDLAGTGFESTVRLAKSNPDTWAPIFIKNKVFLTEALDSYISHLQDFRTALLLENDQKLVSIMRASNEIKRILK